MSDYFLGEIKMFGFNFAMNGWHFCDGSLLSISSNTALYSLLGTTYGGDGQSTFALPDFRGRVPVHQGSGAGLTSRPLGQQGGQEAVTLLTTQMPAHNHSVTANNVPGTVSAPNSSAMPARAVQSVGGQSALLYTTSGTVPITPKAMLPQAVGVTGGSQAHPNMAPYLTVNFQIAVQGLYPTRN